MNFFGKHAHEVAERILEAFRCPEQLPKALAPVFIRREDGTPCRNWSWHNQLLVALCGTCDARGFRQWIQAGRHVRKGSRAIWILAPCLKTLKDTGDAGSKTERQVLIGFRTVPVFAVEDTDGEPLPDDSRRYRSWMEALPLAEVARTWGIHVDVFGHAPGDPLGYYRYSASGNQAIMLGVENLSTWAHELVHAADHRLTGLQGESWCKEIVAELGSAILLECVGQEQQADLGGAYDYIARHANEVRSPVVKACIEVLDRSCACVAMILETAQQAIAAH